MNKLRIALLVSTFALMSASALAEDIDMKPMSSMSTEEAIAARKAARGKKRDELTALDQYAKQQMAVRAEHERASGSSGMH